MEELGLLMILLFVFVIGGVSFDYFSDKRYTEPKEDAYEVICKESGATL